jgi:hypothetical protein
MNIPADKVILIDSDLEITNDAIISFMKDFIDDDRTFGTGFINGPGWLTDHKGLLEHAYYQERMWIPLTMLETNLVCKALAVGQA